MRSNKEVLMEIKNEYQIYIDKLNNIEIPKVEGYLIVDDRNSKVRYYHKSKSSSGEYITRRIPIDNIKLATDLANKHYLQRVKRLVFKRMSQCDVFIDNYRQSELDDLYDKLKPERKKLITPLKSTIEEKLKIWSNQSYGGNSYGESNKTIITLKGDRVRSKSEMLIADSLYQSGLEYKYEKPLIFSNGYKVYPDFTILDPITGKEIYWEHFGLMDNSDYSKISVKKLFNYTSNGIYQGRELITTFETTDLIPNAKLISEIIYTYFLRRINEF